MDPGGGGSGGRPQHVTFAPVPLSATSLSSPNASQWKPTRGGTRRLGVDEQGQYTYKKTPSSTLMASLQLGLQHSIGSIEPKPHRDILMTDFEVVETVDFPAEGSGCTPAHKYKDFTFKTYSPEAMRFFREAFGIPPEDFMLALCDRPLREVSNPGASGSLFYLSADDAFILKTVQKKEARFLQKLLPGYYLNLTQHKRTLLPKFFGLYRYKSGSVNIRIVVMNNLLPSSIKYHEKYDLKGSTYKRRANLAEAKKKSPTWKDLDFAEKHEEGIILAPEKYEALIHSMERDCKVLESFGIMDYSLLLGIHNIDQAIREKAEAAVGASSEASASEDIPIPSRIELSKNFSIVSTEDIPTLLAEEQEQRQRYPEGYIQGRIHGDRVMFYLGLIDILQSYRLKKKLEHGLKSVITDGATVSVHNPSFYSRRFQDFMTTQVFKKDKTKYRTRKNSTNAQIRGRRPGGGVASTGSSTGATARPPNERQNSRDSRTSPQPEPPSYHQAMKGAGLAVSPPYSARMRSLSESVTSSTPRAVPVGAARPNLSPLKGTPPSESAESANSSEAVTSTVHQPLVESRSSGGHSDRAGNFSPLTTTSPDTVVTAGGSSYHDVLSQLDESSSAATAQGGGGGGRYGGGKGREAEVRLQYTEAEGDFARHVRGTSTPIDDVSPSDTPNQTQTFLHENTDVVTAVGNIADSASEAEKKKSSLRREDAVDSSSPTPAIELSVEVGDTL